MRCQEKFFTEKVVRRWNRLPSKAMDAPPMDVIKARPDRAMGDLILVVSNQLTQRGWN